MKKITIKIIASIYFIFVWARKLFEKKKKAQDKKIFFNDPFSGAYWQKK